MNGSAVTSLGDPCLPEHLEEILGSDDYLCGDHFLKLASEDTRVVYRKLEFVARPGRWRGKTVIPGWLELALPRRKQLVYGHSSGQLSAWVERLLISLSSGPVVGTNRQPNAESLPIPLGLTNTYPDSPIHQILGDTNMIVSALHVRPTLGFRNRIYANFDFSTHEDRRILADLFQRTGNTVHVPVKSEQGRQAYLRACRFSDFVLCPRGVGEDTHRVWESLYLGTIPVVLRTPLMSYFARYLPILTLDSWIQIGDVKFMEETYSKLSAMEWQVGELTASRWLQRSLRKA